MYKEYYIVAEQVIAMHDKKLLTKEILECLLDPFADKEFDFLYAEYYAKDGLGAAQIICSTLLPEEYGSIVRKYPAGSLSRSNGDTEIISDFYGDLYDLWQNSIAPKYKIL